MTTAGETGAELRLASMVAWLHLGRGLRQSDVAVRLNISQSQVSRLLDRAAAARLVRTVLTAPADAGVPSQQEASLQRLYPHLAVRVYHLGRLDPDEDLAEDLGQLLALHLSGLLRHSRIIGITSWSRTLAAAVAAVDRIGPAGAELVVETLGDLGTPRQQHEAATVTQRLARAVGATPLFLRIPGIAPTAQARVDRLGHSPHAERALTQLSRLDTVLLGIGPAHVQPPLESGNLFFTTEQFDQARADGAVGEVNLHFLDDEGEPIVPELGDLLIGATPSHIRTAARRIAAAGGPEKHYAIRAAVRGGWINWLLTDSATAQFLIDNP